MDHFPASQPSPASRAPPSLRCALELLCKPAKHFFFFFLFFFNTPFPFPRQLKHNRLRGSFGNWLKITCRHPRLLHNTISGASRSAASASLRRRAAQIGANPRRSPRAPGCQWVRDRPAGVVSRRQGHLMAAQTAPPPFLSAQLCEGGVVGPDLQGAAGRKSRDAPGERGAESEQRSWGIICWC